MKTSNIISGLIGVFLLFPSINHAQVKSKSFNSVIRTLLSHNVPEITIDNAVAVSTSHLFLDAREISEYNVSHIANAVFVGYKNFNQTALSKLNKNSPLIVYCSIGKRSEEITAKLLEQGFTNVQNLYGGIFEWVNQGYPVFDLQNKPTVKVHAYGRFWGQFLNKGEKVY